MREIDASDNLPKRQAIKRLAREGNYQRGESSDGYPEGTDEILEREMGFEPMTTCLEGSLTTYPQWKVRTGRLVGSNRQALLLCAIRTYFSRPVTFVQTPAQRRHDQVVEIWTPKWS